MKYQIVINKNVRLSQWVVRKDESDATDEYMNELGDGVHFVGCQPFDITEYEQAVQEYAAAKQTRQGMYEAKAKADAASINAQKKVR